MCIYIFSPGKTIEIEYASETITLLARYYSDTNRPSTEVVMDFLIKNANNSSELKELYIIYPRAFYNISIEDAFYKTSIGDDELKQLENCNIFDETPTFELKDHQFNRLLNDIPCEMRTYWVENRLKLESKQPDPDSPGKTICYDGYLCQNGMDIKLYETTPIQLFILMNLSKSFTIFQVQFKQGIGPGESQWMRWFVTEPEVNFYEKKILRHLKDKALDRLIANYHILGSYDVLYQIQSYLKAFTMKDPNTKAHAKLKLEAGNLLSSLERLTSNSKVIIKDWRIHVFPNQYWELSDISTYGDVKPAGDFPNILNPHPLRNNYEAELVYQWKTGEKYIPVNEQKLNGRFHISATIKDPNYVYRLLPWIALVLAIFALF